MDSTPTQPTQPTQPRYRFLRNTLGWLGRFWDRGAGHKAVLLIAIPLLTICACCSGGTIFAVAFSATPLGQQLALQTEATETAQAVNAGQVSATRTAHALAFPPSTATASTLPPAETSTPTAVATAASTPSPTPSPTLPSPSPTATPTAVPPPPQPTCIPGAVNCNPWGYNFSPGNLIYSPPGAFCSYFSCIGNFWNGRGYVMECQDGMYSKSGASRARVRITGATCSRCIRISAAAGAQGTSRALAGTARRAGVLGNGV
jgi:hypothetical protein